MARSAARRPARPRGLQPIGPDAQNEAMRVTGNEITVRGDSASCIEAERLAGPLAAGALGAVRCSAVMVCRKRQWLLHAGRRKVPYYRSQQARLSGSGAMSKGALQLAGTSHVCGTSPAEQQAWLKCHPPIRSHGNETLRTQTQTQIRTQTHSAQPNHKVSNPKPIHSSELAERDGAPAVSSRMEAAMRLGAWGAVATINTVHLDCRIEPPPNGEVYTAASVPTELTD